MGKGGMLGKIRQAAGGNSQKVEQGVEKLKGFAKRKTGGKYDAQIDKAGDSATGYLTGEQQNKPDRDSGEGGSGETRR
ncbi:antitoxin [Streptomonospora sp. PA3]|nr:antitoxin [Streptomonospora sp. PA3]MUL43106.1 antitoxin [Streptomonospora sp. PA3]